MQQLLLKNKAKKKTMHFFSSLIIQKKTTIKWRNESFIKVSQKSKCHSFVFNHSFKKLVTDNEKKKHSMQRFVTHLPNG